MKKKTLLKKLKLDDKAFEEIKKEVEAQEKRTNGEIAVAVAPESAHYSFWELLTSNCIAAIFLIILFPFSDKIQSLYRHFYWQNEPSWILPLFFIITAFGTIAIMFYITNIPAIDRIIIPSAVKRTCVNHRAMRYFAESGVYDTKDHSGILIFVSYMERQVRIIADSGISSKISQELWNMIAEEMAENLKKGQTTEAFINAISKCGDLLAEKFPAKEENPNELSDGLMVLEDAEWY